MFNSVRVRVRLVFVNSDWNDIDAYKCFMVSKNVRMNFN